MSIPNPPKTRLSTGSIWAFPEQSNVKKGERLLLIFNYISRLYLASWVSLEKMELRLFMIMTIKSYATCILYILRTNIFTPICPRAKTHVSAFLIPITFLLSSSSHSHWTSSSWSVEFLWTAIDVMWEKRKRKKPGYKCSAICFA